MPFYLVAGGSNALVYQALLNIPNPQRHGAIKNHVEDHGAGRQVLCALEAELVVPSEAGGRDEEGGGAKGEADVGGCVDLFNFEGVEVVWDGIVGGVFKVCIEIC